MLQLQRKGLYRVDRVAVAYNDVPVREQSHATAAGNHESAIKKTEAALFNNGGGDGAHDHLDADTELTSSHTSDPACHTAGGRVSRGQSNDASASSPAEQGLPSRSVLLPGHHCSLPHQLVMIKIPDGHALVMKSG